MGRSSSAPIPTAVLSATRRIVDFPKPAIALAACAAVFAIPAASHAAPGHGPAVSPGGPSAIETDSKGDLLIAGLLDDCLGTDIRCNGEGIYVGRLRSDGKPDARFGGGDGFKTISLPPAAPSDEGYDDLVGMALDDEGRIVVVARTAPYSSIHPYRVVVVRLTKRGKLDSTFSQTAGSSLTDADFIPRIGYSQLPANGLALSGDSILIAGGIGGAVPPYYGGQSLAVAKLSSSGELDPSFGNGGIASVRVAQDSTFERANTILLRPDGRIVIAGAMGQSGPGPSGYGEDQDSFAVAQLLPNGALDPSFAGDGAESVATLTGYGGLYENLSAEAYDLTAQSGGRVLITGSRTEGKGACFDTHFFRVLADGTPDSSFGDDGLAAAFWDCRSAAETLSDADDQILSAGTWTGASIYNDDPDRTMLARVSSHGDTQADEILPLPGVASSILSLTPIRAGFVGGGTSASQRCTPITPPAPSDCRSAVLFKLRGDGTLNPRFGHKGVVRLPLLKRG
jgi:uncharacterized delta-60 repeat protein